MFLKRLFDDVELSDAEYAKLAERGYISVLNENGNIKIVPQVVILENSESKSKLLDIGGKVKAKYWAVPFQILNFLYLNSYLKGFFLFNLYTKFSAVSNKGPVPCRTGL